MNMCKFFIKNYKKEPWQIAAARYCVNNSEKGFTQDGLRQYIKSLYNVADGHIEQFYEEEIYKPAGRQHTRNFLKNESIGVWTPPLDLVSKVTDYDELKEARKNAKQAFWLSVTAIIIAVVTLFVSIFK